ncbi:MAG: 30S ribosomal protein S6 [Candidatus Shapirobacteria bacterium]
MKGNKNKYQMVLVLNPKTEEKEKTLDKLYSWIESNESEIVNKDNLGLKELSYEINGNSKGDFWVLDVESVKPLKLKEFNLLLNRETKIIRYLILKKPACVKAKAGK